MAADDSPGHPGKPPARDLLALVGLCVAALALWEWNVLRAGETLMSITNFDLYSEFYPRHSFAGESLRRGVLPLWDPHQIGGLPFLATYQAGLLYPPNLLYAVLPTGTAMGLLALAHAAAAGVATYLLCRELGRSGVASCLAAIVFMGGGATLFMSNHTNAMNSVPWLPAALYCCVGLERRGGVRWAIALGGCLGLQFLAGREYSFVMTAHVVGLFSAFQLAWLWRDHHEGTRVSRHIGLLALAGVLAAGFVAAQALPTLALTFEGGRTLAGLEGELLEIYEPMSPSFFLANLVNPVSGPIRREYFGWLPIVCFVVGFRLWGRDRSLVFGSLLALLSILLCFGSLTPVYALYRALPLASAFRLPDRFVFLFGFALAIVAAGGLDRILDARRADALRALAPRIGLLLALLLALPFVLASDWIAAGIGHAAEPWRWFTFYGFRPDQFDHPGHAVAYFAASLLLLGIVGWSAGARAGRWLAVAVLLFALVDLGVAQQSRFRHPARDPQPALAAAACYARVPDIAGPHGRHLSYRLPGSYALKDKDGELFGRFAATHYDPLVTLRQAAYFAALEDGGTLFSDSPWSERSLFMGFLSGTPGPNGSKLLDMLSTRVILADSRPSHRPAALGAMLERYRLVGRCQAESDRRPIPIGLYANPRALPRAFVVHDVREADDAESALRAVLAPDFDPATQAVVEGPPPPTGEAAAPGIERGQIQQYDQDRVVIRVDARTPGLLVFNDSWDPEWTVRVDGEDETILPTNSLFRGVAVPAGRSELVFSYRPRTFQLGAGISALCIAVAGLLWWRAGDRATRTGRG